MYLRCFTEMGGEKFQAVIHNSYNLHTSVKWFYRPTVLGIHMDKDLDKFPKCIFKREKWKTEMHALTKCTLLFIRAYKD